MKYIQRAIEGFLDLNLFLPIWLMSFIPALIFYLKTGLDPFMNEKEQALVLASLPEETWLDPVLLVIYISSMIFTVIGIQIALRKAKGEEAIPFLENFNGVFEILGKLIITSLILCVIVAIMIGLAAVTLGLFVPVLIWFSIAAGLWIYALVNEGLTGWAPIGRSMSLLKGKWWSWFGILILVGIFTGLGSMILHSIGTIANRPLGIALGTSLTPIQILVSAFVYLELVKKTETKEKLEVFQ